MLTPQNKSVAIIMATYQGEKFIYEQLVSIAAQTHHNWQLYISDDNSTDKTINIVKCFSEEKNTDIKIYKGPSQGFVQNFLSLLSKDEIDNDYFAFSDQDDVWHPNKLEKAVAWLNQIPESIPSLYCTRTHLVNESGESVGYSPLFEREPSFNNALIQSIGGGNTMVINKAARDIIVRAGCTNVISHDWWIYLLISGAGGKVFHDTSATLDYRQHQHNLIGSNLGLKAKILRMSKIFQGQYKEWNRLHITSLEKNIDLLNAESKEKFLLFKQIHHGSFFRRIYAFFKLRLYRQSKVDNLGIILAAIFGKL